MRSFSAATCDREYGPPPSCTTAALLLGNKICATWTLLLLLEGVGSGASISCSSRGQSCVSKDGGSAGWNSAAHRGPAIDIQLTGGAAALGPDASCCPAWLAHHPAPRFPPPAILQSRFSSPVQTAAVTNPVFFRLSDSAPRVAPFEGKRAPTVATKSTRCPPPLV